MQLNLNINFPSGGITPDRLGIKALTCVHELGIAVKTAKNGLPLVRFEPTLVDTWKTNIFAEDE